MLGHEAVDGRRHRVVVFNLQIEYFCRGMLSEYLLGPCWNRTRSTYIYIYICCGGIYTSTLQ